MANKQQQSKSDKKHRKLTKSPQVSCDISMLSSSPTQSSSSSSFPLTSPKYIAYPSSLPNHDATTDENLLKNFEYSRSDLTLTDRISPVSYSSTITTITQQQTASSSSFPSQISSTKREDSTIVLKRYPSFSKKSIEQYRNTPLDSSGSSSSVGGGIKIKSNDIHYRELVKPNILFVENPVTMPTCCIKSAQSLANNNNNNNNYNTGTAIISDVVINKIQPTSVIPQAYQHQSYHNPHHQISTSPLSSSSSSATTILNDQLRNIRQMFQNATHSTTNLTGTLNATTNNSSSSNKSQQTQLSKNHVTNENINLQTNSSFILANLFKTSDKSTSTTTTSQQHVSTTTALQHSSISSTNNTMLSENSKRDEFLKATMKICLVVSPPSNKLLQVII